jgi:hypothetical protein
MYYTDNVHNGSDLLIKEKYLKALQTDTGFNSLKWEDAELADLKAAVIEEVEPVTPYHNSAGELLMTDVLLYCTDKHGRPYVFDIATADDYEADQGLRITKALIDIDGELVK